MKSMQRMVLSILLVVSFLFGISFTVLQREEKLVAQWEAIQTGRFLTKSCKNRNITYEDVLLYKASLEHHKHKLRIRLEELQRETDMEGNVYYHTVSWEEILEQMALQNYYDLQEDSILVVRVERYNKTKWVETRYYELVLGKV